MWAPASASRSDLRWTSAHLTPRRDRRGLFELGRPWRSATRPPIAKRPQASAKMLFLRAALAVEISGCAAHTPPADLHPKPKVTVLAGDRLVVDGEEVVLADAETPQPGPRAHCRAEIIAGAASSAAAETLIREARYIETEPETPKPFALVHLDGLDLGLTLTSQGLAVPRKAIAMKWCG
jgi:hypothetical protein